MDNNQQVIHKKKVLEIIQKISKIHLKKKTISKKRKFFLLHNNKIEQLVIDKNK
jgi:hypothetical protein